MTSEVPTLGLVLAGGQARRMGGGDKASLKVGGKTILARVLARLNPYCSPIILNANGDPARFSRYGLAVVADSVPDFAGPLAGILAGLDWAAKEAPKIEWLASVPGDCPFLPKDLVPRLHAARIAEKEAACLRALRRMAASGRGPVAGRAPRRFTPRAHRRGPAQDRGVDRPSWCRARRLAGSAVRSVLQRQHAGGFGQGRGNRRAKFRRF